MQVICYLLLFYNYVMTYGEYFTSLTEIEYLLIPHERILTDLESYVEMQEKKLSVLKRYMDLYNRENRNAMKNISSYLENPINVYSLIKRLVSDLDFLLIVTKSGAKFISYLLLEDMKMPFPTEEDLKGAAEGIARLTKVYNLKIKDLANGNLNNIVYTTPMTASDCLELSQALGSQNIKNNDAHGWLLEAQRKHAEKNVSYPFTEFNITYYLHTINNMKGDTKGAFQLSQQLINVNEGGEENYSIMKNDFVHTLEVLQRDTMLAEYVHESLQETPQEILSEKDEKELKNYEEMCRGDLTVPAKISNRLTCRYLNENHPFLKYAPLKVEIMYLNPDLVLFHDVLSDLEIETIKQKATPLLQRAQINNPKTRFLTYATYRISKMAWISDNDSHILHRITRRVAHMTGLNMELTIFNQVVNYGIGGQYEPHYDFNLKEDEDDLATNRIATVLFYMTDVIQGGATVFPELGVRLLPVKGTAAFWFNLHPSLESNYAMRHAACPVLQGNKWVVSKFVDTEPQVFVRPCDLEYQRKGVFVESPQPSPKIPEH